MKQSIPAPEPRSSTVIPSLSPAKAAGVPQPRPRSAPSGIAARAASSYFGAMFTTPAGSHPLLPQQELAACSDAGSPRAISAYFCLTASLISEFEFMAVPFIVDNIHFLRNSHVNGNSPTNMLIFVSGTSVLFIRWARPNRRLRLLYYYRERENHALKTRNNGARGSIFLVSFRMRGREARSAQAGAIPAGTSAGARNHLLPGNP